MGVADHYAEIQNDIQTEITNNGLIVLSQTTMATDLTLQTHFDCKRSLKLI